MNTTTRLTCALAGAVALTGAFTQAASAQTRILLNCFFPPQHFICQDVLGGWAKDVTDATESRVRVAILPQTMAPPPEQLISARAGVFDAAIQMNGFIENEVVGTQVSQLPFTGVSDGRANSLALWNTYEKYLSSNDEYDGVELLGLFVAPGADFYSLTDEPIRSLEDMKSMKMWATPGATAEILKQAGSAVVAGPAVQMTELIQRGVVDGFVGIPASDAMAFNVLPSAKSATVTRLKITTPTFSFFINDDAWAKIDPADQEIKDGAVEMFLKSLELIGTFHPELTSGQLLEVERKMAITKKRSFERWVEKSYRRRSRQETREKRRFARDRFWRGWSEWIALDTTHHALAPVVALVVLSGVIGWSLGSSRSACPTLVLPPEQTGIR